MTGRRADRASRGRRGQALVEFGFVFPILILTMMAIIEFGFLVRDYMAVNYMLSQAAKEASLMRGVSDADVRVAKTILQASGGLDPNRLRIIGPDSHEYGPVFLSGDDLVNPAGELIEQPTPSIFFLSDNGTPSDLRDDTPAAGSNVGSSYARVTISYVHRNLGPYPQFMNMNDITITQTKMVRLE